MRTWNAGVAALLIGVAPSLAAPAPVARLAPADIQKTFFNGQPFTAATPKDIKYTMSFTADGKMTREPAGRAGVKDTGTWKLDKTGFCTTWKGSKPNCFVIVTTGENKWSVMKGSAVIAVWSK
jgi:hypothetical protein